MQCGAATLSRSKPIRPVLAIGGLFVVISRTYYVVKELKVDSLDLKLHTKLELIFLALVEFVQLVPKNLNTISGSK